MSQPATHNAERHLVTTRRKLLPLILLCWGMLVYSWLLAYVPQIATFHGSLLRQLLHSSDAHSLISPMGDGIRSQSICLFKNLLHIPCLLCGLTRSFVLISQGHWQSSMQYHLLGIPAYLTVSFTALFGLISPSWVKRSLDRLMTRPALFIILIAFAVCWVWKLARNHHFW